MTGSSSETKEGSACQMKGSSSPSFKEWSNVLVKSCMHETKFLVEQARANRVYMTFGIVASATTIMIGFFYRESQHMQSMVKTQLDTFSKEVKAEVTGMKAEVTGMKTELKGEIDGMKTELKTASTIETIKQENAQNLQNMKKDLLDEFNKFFTKSADK